jgi:hypothetical protein
LTGRPKKKLEQSTLDQECFQDVDFDYPDLPHERRICRQHQREQLHHNVDVTRVSTEKLLQASLTSLQNIGKRVHRHQEGGGGGGEREEGGEIDFELEMGEDMDGMGMTGGTAMTIGSRAKYPSSSYLRGGLWIGRNMTLVSEELVDSIDQYRMKYLSEVTEISRDTDPRRACHRLTLLASTGMNQVITLANKSKTKIREILEGVANLEPGNSSQLQRFLKTLPIESALTTASRAASPVSTRYAAAVGGGGGLLNGTLRSHSAPNSPNRSRFSTLGSPLHTADLSNRY